MQVLNNTKLNSFSSKIAPIDQEGNLRWTQTLILYALSHGFILASLNALYWDDWIYYSNGPIGVRQIQSECVRWCIPLRGWSEANLITIGPWTIRALTFIFWPLTTVLLYKFLKRTTWLKKVEASYVSLLVLLLPLNGARIALINNYYLFSLTIFVLGAWMTLSPKRGVRLIGLLPLFWSMFTASLQVFVYVLVAALLARLIQKLDIRNTFNVFILVCISLFQFAHRYLLPNIFESMVITQDGYNSILPAFLMRATLFASVLIVPLCVAFLRNLNLKPVPRENILFCIGLALTGVGTFPYLAVGHFANLSDWVLPFLPDESDWNSRHQLLQAFGFAFILLAVGLMFGVRNRSFLAGVVALSICLNITTYSAYFLDSTKQDEIISALHEVESQLANVNAVVVEDETPRFNARDRWIRSYEWTAMIQRSTGLSIEADYDRIQFCEDFKPSKRITISTTNGRFKSLLSGKVGIVLKISDLPSCGL